MENNNIENNNIENNNKIKLEHDLNELSYDNLKKLAKDNNIKLSFKGKLKTKKELINDIINN